jgi:hypothetical protein
MKKFIMTDVDGTELPTHNQPPVMDPRDADELAKVEASIGRWERNEGISTDNAGGEYEKAQIISHLRQKADLLRYNGHVFVMRCRDKATGQLLRTVHTQYGMAYVMTNGKLQSSNVTRKTLDKKGLELVGAWVKATKEVK